MAMNKREKMLALGAGIALGLLLIDAVVIQPISNAYAQLEQRRTTVVDDLREARNLMNARRGAQQRYRQMIAAGLSSDASVAESQVLHAMRSWAGEAGVNLSSVQPERRTAGATMSGFGSDRPRETLREVDLSARANGSLDGITRLLYELETATVPVRIRRIRIAPRSGDVNDLNLEMRASTIYRESPEAQR